MTAFMGNENRIQYYKHYNPPILIYVCVEKQTERNCLHNIMLGVSKRWKLQSFLLLFSHSSVFSVFSTHLMVSFVGDLETLVNETSVSLVKFIS